jgi:hypothetical protein
MGIRFYMTKGLFGEAGHHFDNILKGYFVVINKILLNIGGPGFAMVIYAGKPDDWTDFEIIYLDFPVHLSLFYKVINWEI